MNNIITCLDKGYVRLVDSMGDDLETVNDARVSYAKESAQFSDSDDKLLRFLIREGHMSPFRGSVLKFEIYAPLLTARQWWKYAVSSSHREDQLGWNESSRRYVTEQVEFYIPEEWRTKPANSKQGSAEPIEYLPEDMSPDTETWICYDEFDRRRRNNAVWRKPDPAAFLKAQFRGGPYDLTDDQIDRLVAKGPLPKDIHEYGYYWTSKLVQLYDQGQHFFELAQKWNIATEQARLFLPAYGLYVRWRWTASLASVMHFLNERLEHDAQKEIQVYAQAVEQFTREKFPRTMEAR